LQRLDAATSKKSLISLNDTLFEKQSHSTKIIIPVSKISTTLQAKLDQGGDR
jgi:hypothetical protein